MGYGEFAWLWFAMLIHLTVGERGCVAVWGVADGAVVWGCMAPPCSGMVRVGLSPARCLHPGDGHGEACSRSWLTCSSGQTGSCYQPQHCLDPGICQDPGAADGNSLLVCG